MTVSIDLPDKIAEQFHLKEAEAAKRMLELFAIEGYREGELSRGQVSELLDQSFWETEALLRKYGCGPHQTVAEFEEEVEFLRKFLGR